MIVNNAADHSRPPTFRPRSHQYPSSRSGAVYSMTSATPSGSRWIAS